MYNYLYKILYSKQFGFQKGNSADHANAQLTDQIHQAFEQNKYMLGVFIDHSKAFDTFNHHILITKLEYYIRGGNNPRRFQSHLGNRMQYIQINNFENRAIVVFTVCQRF